MQKTNEPGGIGVGVEIVWERIHRWLDGNAPALIAALASPASPLELDKFLAVFPFLSGSELVRSLQVHDGEEDEVWCLGDWKLLSIEEIEHYYQREIARQGNHDGSQLSSDPRVSDVYWDFRWVPFAYDGSGGFLAVDYAAEGSGRPGQVVRTSASDENVFVSETLEFFLSRFCGAIEAGQFESVDDGIEPRAGFSAWWRPSA